MKKFLQSLLVAILFFFATNSSFLYAQLSAGDIAFVGFNADGDDGLAFIATTTIPSGSVIHFQDNEWNGMNIGAGGAFNTGEGSTTWTNGGSNLAPGTIIEILNLSSAVTRSVNIGTLSGSGTISIGNSGESIFAFTGASATSPTNFLAAITNNNGGFNGATTSGLLGGTGLTAGSTALVLPGTGGADVAAYNPSVGGSTFATRSAALTAFNTATNWVAQDDSGAQDADNTVPDAPFRTDAQSPLAGVTFTIGALPTVNLSVSTNTGTEAGATAITVTTTASSAVSGNQTVNLGVSGTGITAGDYTLSNTVITILNAQTTGSVTFTIVDDALIEGTETATLTISTPSAGITLGSTTSQNITITDNDAALPDLSVGINTPGPLTVNTPFNYTLDVQNIGNANASGIEVSLTLPANVTYNSANILGGGFNNPTLNGSVLTFTGGNVNAANFAQITVNVTPTQAGSLGGATLAVDPNNTIAESNEVNNTITSIATTVNAPPITVNLSVSSNTGTEASATFITVTAMASSAVSGNQTVTLGVSGTGITTGDYFLSNTTITIPNGQTTGTVSFIVADDATPEGTETATLTISNPSAGITLGATTTQNITITNNDDSFLTKVGGATSTNGAESPAFDPGSDRLFVVAGNTVEIYTVSNTGSLTAAGSLTPGITPPAGTALIPNSVDVKNGIVAVSYAVRNTTTGVQGTGTVAFFNASNGSFLNAVDVGALPDMLTFTPDGTKVLVANEGEPNSYNQGNSVDPEGSVSIINIANGVANATVQTAVFTSFNGQLTALRDAGVRIIGPGATVAQDLEPEYITVSPDGLTARITLQENNAIAILNIASATITNILPLGAKNHNLSGNGIDASDQNSGINILNVPVFGLYQPDAIASFTANGQTYYITANEGDARAYTGFNEEIRVGNAGYVLDPTVFPNAAILKQNANLGRLQVTNATGDIDGDTDFDRIEVFGARSFTIWDANGNQIFDSGDQLEQITALRVPTLFNSDGAAATFDTRSDNKGPEPEGVSIGVINSRIYAFIGLERVGDIMVYDVTNPTQPTFVQYINTPEDIAPEVQIFISAADSPTGKPLLISANEVSQTVAVFQIDAPLVCPELSEPAPAAEVTNSICSEGNSCVPIGGSISAPEGICPSGSTLQYSTDQVNWSTTPPIYDPFAAITVYTRCNCDSDNSQSSPTTSITTEPENCSTIADLFWQQLGLDIDGEAADDLSGWSVSFSADGATVAIGAIDNDGSNGVNSGHVRVYRYNGSAWVQVGSDIDGEAAGDDFGWSVALSADGATVAIGASDNDGSSGLNSGHVRVYRYNGIDWVQVGGDIDGEAAGDRSGRSVALSADGATVAIGAPENDGINGSNSGHVRVYRYDGIDWVQVGSDIDGEAAEDQSGYSVALSDDGTTVAIGATDNDGSTGNNSGHVRVYRYNGSAWLQVGGDIDGEVAGDESGWSVACSADGATVAIGAVLNDGSTGNNSGHVRVYRYNGSAWVQVGSDIDGEAAGDVSGWSVALSADGATVAIGATENDNSNGLNSGHVRVYRYNGSAWVQVGDDIDGEAAEDEFGPSVALSEDGTKVAIGGILNDGNNGSNSGHVRVYEIGCNECVATLSGSTTICADGTANLTVNVTEGTGPYTIGIDNNGDQTADLTVPNYTSGSNIPVNPAATTTYTLLSVIDNGGENVACEVSGTATVTVNFVSGGFIQSDQTICSGGDPAPFTEIPTDLKGKSLEKSAANAITYRWESNTTGCDSTFTAIQGATGATYDPGVLTQTTYFRRVTISTLNGVACEAISNCLTITVNNVTAGSIAADQTICSGGDPTAFTSTTAGSGSGTITYRWESNTTGCDSTFTAIQGATGAIYDPGVLTQTTYFRRVTISTLDGVACEAISNCVTVTVNRVTAGSIAADQTICSGGDPTAFTSTTAGSGSGTITYRWESNTTGCDSTFTAIQGATGATYDPGVLTQTTYFRRVTISTLNGVACEAVSNCVTVTVNRVTAGNIAADQTICSGGDPTAFTSTTAGSGSGTITYRWESSTTNCESGFTVIQGATGAIYDPGVLTQTTYFRRITISTLNGVACEAISNCLTVTVNQITPGEIGGTQTVCITKDPAPFTSVTAATGSGTITYQWESSTTSCDAGFTPIDGATGATFDAAKGQFKVTTYFRRRAISTLNGVACDEVSNCITITVLNVDCGQFPWNGN